MELQTLFIHVVYIWSLLCTIYRLDEKKGLAHLVLARYNGKRSILT